MIYPSSSDSLTKFEDPRYIACRQIEGGETLERKLYSGDVVRLAGAPGLWLCAGNGDLESEYGDLESEYGGVRKVSEEEILEVAGNQFESERAVWQVLPYKPS